MAACLVGFFLPPSAVPPAVELFIVFQPFGGILQVGTFTSLCPSAFLHQPDQFWQVDLQLASSRLCLILFRVHSLPGGWPLLFPAVGLCSQSFVIW